MMQLGDGCYTINQLDTSTNGTYGFRDPQAISGALATLGSSQPKAFRSL